MHNNIDELYEYISRDILPVDYGGEELSVEGLNGTLSIQKLNMKNCAQRLIKRKNIYCGTKDEGCIT